MAKILLVEDDETLSELVCEYLSENGYEVEARADAEGAANVAYERKFDLFVIDVKIPKGDGFSLLSSLRAAGVDTPAIFTTSLGSLTDLEAGYDSGCDDYLRKPFELRELLIRIQTLLKRGFSHTNDDFVEIEGGFRFFIQSKELRKNGEKIPLRAKESELLELFLQNKNKLLSKDEIFTRLWSFSEEPSEQSLRVYVKNLRAILGKQIILNKRGDGYMYV
jgi:DNA-binding response OmpR family regulator